MCASLIAQQDPRVRAKIVYFEAVRSRTVFSTGSITWYGSLSHNISGDVYTHEARNAHQEDIKYRLMQFMPSE